MPAHRRFGFSLAVLSCAVALTDCKEDTGTGYTNSPSGDGSPGDSAQAGDSSSSCSNTVQLQFSQPQVSSLDVLFVVSNAASMGGEQTALGQSASQFLVPLTTAGVDYRLGVISGDVADGGVLHAGASQPSFITPATVDPAGALLANLALGTGGPTRQTLLEATAMALGKGPGWQACTPTSQPPNCDSDPTVTPNPGFLRRGYCDPFSIQAPGSKTCEGTSMSCLSDSDCQDAPLRIVFFSDTDDTSFGPTRYYWRLFESYKGAGNEGRVMLASVSGPPDPGGGCLNPSSESAAPGDRLAELVSMAGDGVWSICVDIGTTTTAIMTEAIGLRSRYALDSLPHLAGNIPCGAQIPGPFCVRVGGVELAPSSYTFDATTNEVVFGAASVPAPGSVISIEFATCTETSACLTSDICGVGSFCNAFGSCQRMPACYGNTECAATEICNAYAAGAPACIDEAQCGSNAHCSFGEYCSSTTGNCSSGCRRTGDCPLGNVCIAGVCQLGGTTADCTICPADPTPDAGYCDYGEVCSMSGSCQAHPEMANLCDTCTAVPCPGNLVCMLDYDLGNHQYCTTTCSTDLDCPNGYSDCGKIQIVDPATECTSTGICSNGAPCVDITGGATAYCGCISDDECSMGADVCFMGNCLNTGLPCNNDGDCSVSCVQTDAGSGTVGACITDIGICGKDSGFLCSDLRSGDASCIDYLP